METVELRQKTEFELKELRAKLKQDVIKIGREVLRNKEKNVRKIGHLKKDLARVETVLNEKRILSEIENSQEN